MYDSDRNVIHEPAPNCKMTDCRKCSQCSTCKYHRYEEIAFNAFEASVGMSPLNLSLLLSESIGEAFYSTVHGRVVQVTNVDPLYGVNIKIAYEEEVQLTKDGAITPGGICILYPSRELFDKYGMDSGAAWYAWYNTMFRKVPLPLCQ